jgi:hypothetical protein
MRKMNNQMLHRIEKILEEISFPFCKEEQQLAAPMNIWHPCSALWNTIDDRKKLSSAKHIHVLFGRKLKALVWFWIIDET